MARMAFNTESLLSAPGAPLGRPPRAFQAPASEAAAQQGDPCRMKQGVECQAKGDGGAGGVAKGRIHSSCGARCRISSSSAVPCVRTFTTNATTMVEQTPECGGFSCSTHMYTCRVCGGSTCRIQCLRTRDFPFKTCERFVFASTSFCAADHRLISAARSHTGSQR